MKYIKFTINNYKAISSPVTLNFSKTNIIPIIGVNEGGKTTLLKSVYCFDYRNDTYTDTFNHLKNVGNIYVLKSKNANITAYIEGNTTEILAILDEFRDSVEEKRKVQSTKYREILNNQSHGYIKITRVLNGKQEYSELIVSGSRENLDNGDENQRWFCEHECEALSKRIVDHCPAIIYYDDFRDKFEDKIYLSNNTNGRSKKILETIFYKTFENANENDRISLNDLTNDALSENAIESACNSVTSYINQKLTDKWKLLHRLEPKEQYNNIKIEIKKKDDADGKYIHINIKETIQGTDEKDKDVYFDLDQRSKGFYWFFNFTLKTTFNHSSLSNKYNIYLLDEPGCYLHSSAQNGLCEILRDFGKSDQIIVYNTHSEHLLDEQFIPATRVAFKDKNGSIALVHFSEYKSSSSDLKFDALAPLRNAFRISPSINQQFSKDIIIVLEGITDWVSFLIFDDHDNVGFLLSRGAESTIDYCSWLLSLQSTFICLLDDDPVGKKTQNKINENFGEYVNCKTYGDDNKLEHLYDKNELKTISAKFFQDQVEIDYKKKKSLEKLLYKLYSIDRAEVVKHMPNTYKNFKQIIDNLLK